MFGLGLGVRVCVTLDDLSQGRPGNCYRCPIAIAIRRTFNACVTVTEDHCVVRKCGKGGQLYRLPRKVRRFIRNFDRDLYNCRPFSFRLKEVTSGLNEK